MILKKKLTMEKGSLKCREESKRKQANADTKWTGFPSIISFQLCLMAKEKI